MNGNVVTKSNLDNFELFEEYFLNFSSTHTRISYKNDISGFLNFVCKGDKSVGSYGDIERKHVIEFRNWLKEFGGQKGEGHAPKTISRKLAALSSYFHYLVENGVMESNPATSVKRPRRDVLTPTNALTSEQVVEFLGAIDESSGSGKLHKAILTTFFTTGLRKSEVLNLKRKNFKEINGYKILEFMGKGGKSGQKLLHPLCIEVIELYIGWMKSIDREHHDEDWLFQPTRNPKDPGNLNKSLNPKTINEIVNKYAKKIGLNFNLSPHSARATFISELLNQGIDIYKVAREVNHSSVVTTSEYDKRRKKLADGLFLELEIK